MLAGFNTEWCIAGEGTAASYLRDSDIIVYFSEDNKGKSTIPRAAIVTDGERITEVRGIMQKGLAKQHLDDYIAPVVAEKLSNLPGGSEWRSAMEDMQRLATIHFKDIQGERHLLTRDDLVFLYELDYPIKNLGYGRDSRIDELRGKRNPLEDASVVFSCRPDQIAKSEKDITPDTKAYIGPLFPRFFERLWGVEHVYTSFPEGKIRRFPFVIEGKSSKDLLSLTVSDLGFSDNATADQIYRRAQELGLELCTNKVGPRLRLIPPSKPVKEWLYIGMKKIEDDGGGPGVFGAVRSGDAVWFRDYWAIRIDDWSPSTEFVFSLPLGAKA